MERYYKKKPLVVEAIRFNGSSTHRAQILHWIQGGNYPDTNAVHTCDLVTLSVKTMEGELTVKPGDWIIKGIGGEFYPCEAHIFDRTYECLGSKNEPAVSSEKAV